MPQMGHEPKKKPARQTTPQAPTAPDEGEGRYDDGKLKRENAADPDQAEPEGRKQPDGGRLGNDLQAHIADREAQPLRSGNTTCLRQRMPSVKNKLLYFK